MVRFRVETIPVQEQLSIDEEKAFLNSVVNYFRNTRGHAIIPATTNTIFRTFPEGAIAATYGTYKIDLTQCEETIWKAICTGHRRKIKRAEKIGIDIKSGLEFAEIAHQLIKDTFKRSNLGFMKLSEFIKYLAGLNNNVNISVAEHKGKIQGCLVIPFSQHSAYCVYAGTIPEPEMGLTNLLHWESIKYFNRLGVKFYDFVGVRIDPEKGSKQEGLRQYKERFGGNLYVGYLWKYNLNLIGYLSYSLGMKLLKGGDIIDAEKHKLGKVNVI